MKHEESGAIEIYKKKKKTVVLDKEGQYTVTLEVKDPTGASNKKSFAIVAGNEAPKVKLTLSSNKNFFFPDSPIKYSVEVSAEEGLVGLTVHPDFPEKPWIYLLYTNPEVAKHVFARWDFKDDQLVESSKKMVLKFPVQRETCCHTEESMAWNADHNLFMTIGNNTGNTLSSHTDERAGRHNWDNQRGAANTNDLRGKNLRIHPEDDGTYTIPAGNLFPPGTPNTRPEIYTMGHRNT